MRAKGTRCTGAHGRGLVRTCVNGGLKGDAARVFDVADGVAFQFLR